MLIEFEELSSANIYHLMTQSLIPRPVAWVLTENEDKSLNLAPFSYFTAVSSNPPLIMISVGKKPSGEFKDTRVNIERTKHFVIHIAHRELASVVTETSRTLPLGESEVIRSGLDVTPFDNFPLPRLDACRIAMACELFEVKEIGPAPQTLIFGEIKALHIDDQFVATDVQGRLKIDAGGIDPLGRLGASEYSTQGGIITIPRPE